MPTRTIRSNKIALALLAAAPLALSACAESGSDDAETTTDSGTETNNMSNDAPANSASDSMAKAEAFGAMITEALGNADAATIIANAKAVNLPEGWQQMITPMLGGMGEYDLKGEVLPRSDFTNEDLMWPDPAPAAYDDVTHILVVSYEQENDSGRRTFAMVEDEGEWKVLFAQ
ncbi:MAG: hypothetical protein AAF297_05865 [Planctomycetota bacterium]